MNRIYLEDILLYIIDTFKYIFTTIIGFLDRFRIGEATLFDLLIFTILLGIILNIVIALPKSIKNRGERRK